MTIAFSKAARVMMSRGFRSMASRQGLTLVHFSAQRKRFCMGQEVRLGGV